jgi:hypothetical protein
MLAVSWVNMISWVKPGAIWAPAALVILVAALGLTVAGAPPARRGARGLWLAAIFVFGSLAVAASVWQAQQALHYPSDAAAAPHEHARRGDL